MEGHTSAITVGCEPSPCTSSATPPRPPSSGKETADEVGRRGQLLDQYGNVELGGEVVRDGDRDGADHRGTGEVRNRDTRAVNALPVSLGPPPGPDGVQIFANGVAVEWCVIGVPDQRQFGERIPGLEGEDGFAGGSGRQGDRGSGGQVVVDGIGPGPQRSSSPPCPRRGPVP
jgi:hypothetical protein